MTQVLSQTITGTYAADEKTLKITTEDVTLDVDVMLEPKEVWATLPAHKAGCKNCVWK